MSWLNDDRGDEDAGVRGTAKAKTDKALLVDVDTVDLADTAGEVWIPFSLCEEAETCAVGDEVDLVVPTWILERAGLL